MLSSVISFRNPNGSEYKWTGVRMKDRQRANPIRIGLAEIGGLIIIPIAIAETAMSLIANLFSSQQESGEWARSSSFTILWSLGFVTVMNFWCNDLIQTERVARACILSSRFFEVPIDAL